MSYLADCSLTLILQNAVAVVAARWWQCGLASLEFNVAALIFLFVSPYLEDLNLAVQYAVEVIVAKQSCLSKFKVAALFSYVTALVRV